MVINLSKVFLQTQSLFIVSNQKQIKGKELAELQMVQQNVYPEYKSYIKLHIAAVILHHLFSLNPLIPTYCHQEEPLRHSVFAEPKIFTRHKQLIFILRKTGSGKRSFLKSKGLAKLLARIQRLYQITYIFCNTVASISIQPFDTI